MSERIEDLRSAVEDIHLCKAVHVESVPIREMFGKQVVWEGVVEVFDIPDHNAKRCYAWRLHDGKQYHYATVLNMPPVSSALTAVRAWLMTRKA